VRVRTLELRLLALVLAALWTTAFAVVLLGYRPGGPIDLLVGIAAAPPIAIALAAVIWPPVARDERAFAAIAWLGITSLLVLVPSILGILGQVDAGGAQTLVPSAEAAYPWLVALATTAVFAGLGVARAVLGESAVRRRRLVRGIAFGASTAVLAGGLFAGAALANEVALRDRTIAISPFGPTDPAAALPDCGTALEIAPTARLEMRLTAEVDGRRYGDVTLAGVRAGRDVRWTGYVAGARQLGQVGAAMVNGRAWTLARNGDWQSTDTSALGDRDLDGQIARTALGSGNRAVAERHGIDVFDGARAQHCRIAVDGPTFRAAVPEVTLLVGDADLARFRGELDYWVFADGELGRVVGRVNGDAVDIANDAIQATIELRLEATDRGSSIRVAAPG